MANHIFASLLVAFCLISFGESKLSKTSALRQSIFADYDHLVKPDEQVTVKLGISILNLEICPHKQILTSHSWLRIFWKDSRLAWDPSEWDGISQINIDANELWIPDVVPYNGEQVKPHAVGFRDDMSKILIMSTGDVIFVPPVIHRTFCPIDFANWPWGEQNCTLIFGSWTYHENVLDLQPLTEGGSSQLEPLDTKDFVNPRINIVSTSYQRNSVKYVCCPDNYPNLKFNIIFEQKSVYMKDAEMKAP